MNDQKLNAIVQEAEKAFWNTVNEATNYSHVGIKVLPPKVVHELHIAMHHAIKTCIKEITPKPMYHYIFNQNGTYITKTNNAIQAQHRALFHNQNTNDDAIIVKEQDLTKEQLDYVKQIEKAYK